MGMMMSERERMRDYLELCTVRDERMAYLRKARRDLGYVAPELMEEHLTFLYHIYQQIHEANHQAVRLWHNTPPRTLTPDDMRELAAVITKYTPATIGMIGASMVADTVAYHLGYERKT